MTTIPLQYPITANGEELVELEIKRPKIKHLKAMEKAGVSDVARMASLIVELAAIPPSSVDQIDAADFRVISEAISGFFEDSLATGGTS